MIILIITVYPNKGSGKEKTLVSVCLFSLLVFLRKPCVDKIGWLPVHMHHHYGLVHGVKITLTDHSIRYFQEIRLFEGSRVRRSPDSKTMEIWQDPTHPIVFD